MKSKIKTISNEETEKHIERAKEISPDPNDVDYFALALYLNCALCSNDKDLKNQKIVRVYSTSDLLKLIP